MAELFGFKFERVKNSGSQEQFYHQKVLRLGQESLQLDLLGLYKEYLFQPLLG